MNLVQQSIEGQLLQLLQDKYVSLIFPRVSTNLNFALNYRISNALTFAGFPD